MHIRITHRPGFLLGSRFVCPDDGPMQVDDGRGRALVAAGLAVACAPLAVEPEAAPERPTKPPKVERAVLKR